MFCNRCGKPVTEGAKFCNHCGNTLPQAAAPAAAGVAAAPAAAAPAQPAENMPTLYGLRCPHCGGEELDCRGEEASVGRTAATAGAWVLGGALGAVIANSIQNKKTEDQSYVQPLMFKCAACKKTFTALPLNADPAERLAVPCIIEVTRPSGVVGCAVAQNVYLNGVRAAVLKNGESVTFNSYLVHNHLFFTDANGTAFKEKRTFIAQPGGVYSFNFNRKFID